MTQIFDALSGRSPIKGRLFLEASAGCGKTFAIEHLVVQLLLNDASLNLKDVLIVTFTKAATKDLKRRIHETLMGALRECETDAVVAPYLKEHVNRCLEAGEQASWRLQQLLSTIEEASIYTIHGYAHKMLSSFFFEAGISIDEEEPPLLNLQQTQQFLKEEARKEEFNYAQWHLVQKKHLKDVHKLVEELSLLASEEIEPQAPFSEFIKGVGDLCDEVGPYPELISDITSWAQANKGLCQRSKLLHPKWTPFLNSLESIFEGNKDNIPHLLLHPNPLPLLINPSKKPLIKEGVIEKLVPLIEKFSCQNATMLRLAQAYKKSAPQQVTMNNLLSLMKEALNSLPFLENVRRLTRVIIIDEFQDTDQLQWEIFKTLFFEHAETFCVVGDPKQSIYGFRNANLSTYLQAKKLFGKENLYTLNTNWRSSSQLIDQLNTLLSEKNAPGWLSFSETEISIQYEHVQTPFEKTEETPLVIFTASSDPSTKWPSHTCESQSLFPFIVKEIFSLQPAVPLHEIAILIKDRFQANRLQEFLTQYHIPSSIASSRPLQESAIWPLLIALIHAINHPSPSTVAAFLASPIFGSSFSDLTHEGHLVKETLPKIYALKHQFLHANWIQFINDCFSLPINLSAKTLYQHLQQQDNALLEETLHFLFSVKVPSTLEKFQHDLEHAPNLSSTQNPKKVCTSPNSVKIMTTHMSKGLEYDVIFALGLCSRSVQPSNLVKVEGVTHVANLQNKHFLSEAIDKEKMRLFYVALTRARQKVYVPFIEDALHKKVPVGRASAAELFFSRLANSFLSYSSLYEEVSKLSVETLQQKLHSIGLSRVKIEKSLTLTLEVPQAPLKTENKKTLNLQITVPKREVYSFSSLVDAPHTNLITYKEERTKLGLPRGPHIGTILHSLLEQAILNGLYKLKNPLLPWIKKQTLHSPLEGWEQVLEEILNDAFSLPFLPQNQSIKNLDPEHIKTEVPFQFLQQDQSSIKGFIDLLFQWEETLYIVDWKGNYLGETIEDYKPQKLHEEMQRHQYHIQAKLYEKATKGAFATLKFGGCYYLFVRGLSQSTGVYTIEPSMRFVDV